MDDYSEDNSEYSSSDDSKSLSDFDEDYETFLFGKVVKPTYIEREEEIQKDEAPEFNEDLYRNDLIGRYDRMSEIRSTLESEVMVLISSLIVRESLDISSKTIGSKQVVDSNFNESFVQKKPFIKPSEIRRVKTPASNVASTLLKNIYQSTGNIPMGRFNTLMPNSSKMSSTDNLINITSVSPQATESLRDLSALLQRERGNIFHECDAIILSQHPRFVTMYILENRIVETHLLPLLDVVEKTCDVNQRTIIGEMLGILNFLVTPPAREWLEYWQGVDRLSKNNKHPIEVTNHPEFMKQQDIIHKYAAGLAHLKRSLNQTFYLALMHLRLEIQNWRYNGFKSAENKLKVQQLKLKEAELIKLRDTIINEQKQYENDVEVSDNEDTEDDLNKKGRLKKSKARTNQINMELLEVQKKLLKDADEVRNASLTAEVQSNLIRNFVYNLIKLNYNISPTEYLTPLVMICDNEHVTLLDIFLQEFLEIFQTSSVQMGLSDIMGSRVSYIHPDIRAKLWEFLRLIHVVMMAIPNTTGLNISNSNTQTDKGTTNTQFNSSWINPRIARIKMSKLRQANKQSRHHRYWSQKHTVQMLPFQPLYYSQYSISLKNNSIDKKLLEKIRLFVGVDDDFDLIHKIQDGGENESISYNLGVLMNALSYDLLRDAGDEYSQPNDWKILISVHTWIIEHYSNLFVEINKKRSQDNLTLLLGEYMLVSLKSFIGQHSTLTFKLLPELFLRLRGNGNLTVKNAESFYLIFRLISADLHLIKLHINNRNSNVLQICRDAIGNYLSNRLIKRIFWVLTKWKPIVGIDLITSALHLLKLLKQLVNALGYVEYSPISHISLGNKLDIDDDFSDDEAVALKKVTIENLYHRDHRQLRCGRIISSLIGLFSYSLNPITNDLIIRYLEEALSHGNHAICWDLPSIQSLNRILSSDSLWRNPQTRWIAQFAFDIVESFFLKWSKNNLFLPLELWFFKNRKQATPYSSTCPMHLQSIHKLYGEDTIDFEISRHLNNNADIKNGKYASSTAVNEAIASAIETFGDSDYLLLKNTYSNTLLTFSESMLNSISQYVSITNLSFSYDLNKMMKLILGNQISFIGSNSSPSGYSTVVSDRILSSLQDLYKNVSEAIEIAEIQADAFNDMASLIEIPSLVELEKSGDLPLWEDLISKLGLRVIIINNSIKMYGFDIDKSLVKERFNQLSLSTRHFTSNTIQLFSQSLIDIAAEAYEKAGSDTLKRLIDKLSIAANSLIRYSQMGQDSESATIPFTTNEVELISEGPLKSLMDALGVVNFDLKFKNPHQILRLKNILSAIPFQLDEILSLSILVQYIIKFGIWNCFDKCYDKITTWESGDLIIEFNGFRPKSKVEGFSRLYSLLLSANWYSDRIVLPGIIREWSKRITIFMKDSMVEYKETELITRIREWRVAVSKGQDPFTPVDGVFWNTEQYDSDFELDESKNFTVGGKRVVYDSDDSPVLVKSSRRSSIFQDSYDYVLNTNNVETHLPESDLGEDIPESHSPELDESMEDLDLSKFESQSDYIRMIYQNSLRLAKEGVCLYLFRNLNLNLVMILCNG